MTGALLAVATTVAQHDALRAAGPQAARLERMWWIYTAVLASVCVLVVLAVLLAVWRRRSRAVLPEPPALSASMLPEGAASRPVQTIDPRRERRALTWVSASTIATVIALGLLLAESLVAARQLEQLAGADALHVEIVGHQWWWGVRYPDADPTLQVITANEIHIPVGRTVVLDLSAVDVIHSFWAPSLHGKRDLIPGHPTSLTLRADHAGSYRGQCAEFCGHAHAQMAFVVIAEPPARFEAWRARQRAAPPAPSNDLQRRGQQVFLNGPCAMCHTIAGTSAQGTAGPDLSHLASRNALAAESFPNRRGWLAGWILDPQHMKPGNRMPSITLPPDDLHALVAYLESLR